MFFSRGFNRLGDALKGFFLDFVDTFKGFGVLRCEATIYTEVGA